MPDTTSAEQVQIPSVQDKRSDPLCSNQIIYCAFRQRTLSVVLLIIVGLVHCRPQTASRWQPSTNLPKSEVSARNTWMCLCRSLQTTFTKHRAAWRSIYTVPVHVYTYIVYKYIYSLFIAYSIFPFVKNLKPLPWCFIPAPWPCMTIEPVNIWRTDTYTGPKVCKNKYILVKTNNNVYIYMYIYTGRETFL